MSAGPTILSSCWSLPREPASCLILIALHWGPLLLPGVLQGPSESRISGKQQMGFFCPTIHQPSHSIFSRKKNGGTKMSRPYPGRGHWLSSSSCFVGGKKSQRERATPMCMTLKHIVSTFSRSKGAVRTLETSQIKIAFSGTLLHGCWWECKLVQPLWEAVWKFS